MIDINDLTLGQAKKLAEETKACPFNVIKGDPLACGEECHIKYLVDSQVKDCWIKWLAQEAV